MKRRTFDIYPQKKIPAKMFTALRDHFFVVLHAKKILFFNHTLKNTHQKNFFFFVFLFGHKLRLVLILHRIKRIAHTKKNVPQKLGKKIFNLRFRRGRNGQFLYDRTHSRRAWNIDDCDVKLISVFSSTKKIILFPFRFEYISNNSSIYKSILWGNCEGVNEKYLNFSWERKLRVKADDDDDDSTHVCSHILKNFPFNQPHKHKQWENWEWKLQIQSKDF